MPRAHIPDQKGGPSFVHGVSRTRYIVVRDNEVWLIKFAGEEYGPYNTEREAILFAIEAAYMLGAQGEPTQVLRLDETGETRPEWTYGNDPYPPRH